MPLNGVATACDVGLGLKTKWTWARVECNMNKAHVWQSDAELFCCAARALLTDIFDGVVAWHLFEAGQAIAHKDFASLPTNVGIHGGCAGWVCRQPEMAAIPPCVLLCVAGAVWISGSLCRPVLCERRGGVARPDLGSVQQQPLPPCKGCLCGAASWCDAGSDCGRVGGPGTAIMHPSNVLLVYRKLPNSGAMSPKARMTTGCGTICGAGAAELELGCAAPPDWVLVEAESLSSKFGFPCSAALNSSSVQPLSAANAVTMLHDMVLCRIS